MADTSTNSGVGVSGQMPAPKPVTPPAAAQGTKPAMSPAASGGAGQAVKPVAAASAGGLKMGAAVASAAAAPKPALAPAFTIEGLGKRNPYLKMLAYGEYGSGKTWLMGTAADVPEMRDVILISAESGELTLFDPDHAFDQIDVVWAKTYKAISQVYEFLKLHCQLRDAGEIQKLIELEARMKQLTTAEIGDEPKMYRTCILDSLTEVETYCMNQLLGIKETTRLDEEVMAAEWAQYRQNHTMVQRLVRSFRDLPMHVLFTAARTFVQDDQKKFTYMPYLTGKLAAQVQGFMDVVGYLRIGQASEDGKIPRQLAVQPTGRFAAKCRFSTYKKPYFDNPTIGSILKDVGLMKGQPASK